MKLKIHFLEELLRKSDPNLNQTALKENTDLRVDKVTLQKDLSKIKKQLAKSEKDAEALKERLQDGKEQNAREQANQQLRDEVDALRNSLDEKESEVDELRNLLSSKKDDRELVVLNDSLEDLEIELREKDRLLEEKDVIIVGSFLGFPWAIWSND